MNKVDKTFVDYLNECRNKKKRIKCDSKEITLNELVLRSQQSQIAKDFKLSTIGVYLNSSILET